MPDRFTAPEIPFQIDEWVIDRKDPSKRGQYTGRYAMAGPYVMVELRYPDKSTKKRPLNVLESAAKAGGTSIDDRLNNGSFGRVRDLQRLITFEKLKGTLHEVVYSMEAAQIDFYPYQFKPVLKFINSPTERLIIADEVGLGKTIESALIWMELRARRQAKRLLVVCPKILTDKWRDELRNKFQFDARVVDFRDLQQEVTELKNTGPIHPFVLIAPYTGLRPPKKDLGLLDIPPEADGDGTVKTRFLRELRHWPLAHPPFDLVIFDEAHYMRNAGTATFHLGESLTSHNETGVLCVSATPVNNSNVDLHSLLRLIDRDFFETQGMFDELLTANRPTIRSINTLSRSPIDWGDLQEAAEGMSESPFINKSPLFKQFLALLGDLEQQPQRKSLLVKTQDTAEKLNLLGSYINRTRRVQVEEKRPERRPWVLPVEYGPEEMALYNAILKLVRKLCQKNNKLFHVFRVLGLQLRAASCLPVIAQDIREGRIGRTQSQLDDLSDLLSETFGDEVFEWDENSPDGEEDMYKVDLKELVKYDFEANDGKFKQLLYLLENTPEKGEKVVIFAYYRPTLAYLRRRLVDNGYTVATIHGGVSHEDRWLELDKFKEPSGPRILLSSEVGSEGIDLQFCRIVVNYDLPWNPMRVEQRIGRIDRVGQKADVLTIANFKVKGTVEERLYDRLHSKLLMFANTLGDLEAVIGEEMQKLTLELLSQNLTPEEEQKRMDKAERVIEERVLQIQNLEESGDSLVALSDYVQKKVREDREKGRYIQAEELEDYLKDFFDREFLGTDVDYNTPAKDCIRIRLSPEARASLNDFIRDDHTLGARPLRQREIAITLRKDVHRTLTPSLRKTVGFINHLSPLIRWITGHNQARSSAFYNVSALTLREADLPPGEYCYRIERWTLRGLSTRETMAYAVKPLAAQEMLDASQAERVVQSLLRNGEEWDFADCDLPTLTRTHDQLKDDLSVRFGEAVQEFMAENNTTVQIRVQRAANHWDRLINQSERAIQTMKMSGRDEKFIRARETRLRNEHENRAEKIRELKKGTEIDPEPSDVAAGVFRVMKPSTLS
jgi:SNF2 family DNA or RNA helicase